MKTGTKFLIGSALRALHAANARSPIATDGPASIPAFAFGWPASELPTQHMAAYAVSAAYGVGRGALRTTGGKLGLVLTAGAAATLWQEHRRMELADDIVEKALVTALGRDYRQASATPPLPPRTSHLSVVPTKRVHKRYVHDERVVYGDHGIRTSLDIWRRPDIAPDAAAPVLVQIHGGAWITGNQEVQAYPLMSHLVERGWVCVAATYRLSPKAAWPAHIEDVKRAVAWTKDNIERFGGDPSWLAITGGSAGGHLVSLAALTPNDPQFQPGFEDADTSVDVAVPFYGIYDWTNRDGTGRGDLGDMLARTVIQRPLPEVTDVLEQASPMTHIRSDAVPFLFLHGTNDSLVPVDQARSMVQMLRAVSDSPVAYMEFPGAQHAFDMFASSRTRATVEGVERFLNHARGR